jgi:glycosyltransferase involved in cell wall biosynthesis
MKVSVLMPIHNEEKYLEEAVTSVLNQSFKDFELIIINDGSNDKSLEIALHLSKKDERVKVIDLKKNVERSAARNRGLKIAKGEYIAFLDGDDLYHKDKLKKQVEFLEKNKEVDVTWGKFKLFGLDDRENVLLEKTEGLKEILMKRAKEDIDNLRVGDFFGLKGSLSGADMMIRRKVFEKVRFDEKLKGHEDYDLLFQIIGKDFKIKLMRQEKPLYFYRIHGDQSIFNKEKMAKARDSVLKKLRKGVYFE